MKTRSFLIFLTGIFILSAVSAQATIILQEDFSTATIANGQTLSSSAGLIAHQWYDFTAWQIVTDGANKYAQHLGTIPDNTHILFTGIDATSLGIGTQLQLSFDYSFGTPTTGARAFAYLVGLDFPSNSLDPFAPWLDDAAGGFGSPDTNDGTVLTRLDLTIPTSGFVGASTSIVTLSQQYDAIVVAFVFGDGQTLQAVDNVTVNSTVPEPATMLLLGSGLLGLWGFKRKFRQ